MSDARSDTILGAGRYLELRRRNNWEFAERRGVTEVVFVVAVTPERQAVLVEQYREPVQARVIEWAAGLVGDGEGAEAEDVLAAARREMEEETGFRATGLSVISQGPSSAGLTSEIVTFVLAEGLQKTGPGGGVHSEEITVHLPPLAEIDSWLDARVQEGCLIDPKVSAGLYFLLKRPPPG